MNAPTPRSMILAFVWLLLAVMAVQLAIQKIGHRPGFGKSAMVLRMNQAERLTIC